MSALRSLAAYARLPDPRPVDEVDEEIGDELEFHLEMRTLDGVRAGLTREEARRKALDRFGDLARIHRECRRILVGDRVMLQRLQAVLTLLLLAAVMFLGVRFYLWQRASEEAMAKMMQSLNQIAEPMVVETVPANGASDVDPGLTEIRATFSKPMLDGSWSWVQISRETFPEAAGESHYLDDQKTCALPVRLRPGRKYRIWLNSQGFHNFTDRSGRPAVPYYLEFTTRR